MKKRAKQFALILLVLAGAAILLACGAASMFAPQPTTSPVKMSDVVGIWSRSANSIGLKNINYALEIEFMADGTFKQTIASDSPSVAARQNGKWHLSGAEVILDRVLIEDWDAKPGASPWRAGTSQWWMIDVSIPGRPFALYGGLGLDPDTFNGFMRISPAGPPASGEARDTAP